MIAFDGKGWGGEGGRGMARQLPPQLFAYKSLYEDSEWDPPDGAWAAR